MSLRFIVRSTQLNAWYSSSGAQAGKFSNLGPGVDDPAITSNGASGVFGGKVISMVPASVVKGLTYPGALNICGPGASGAFSVLARLVPHNTESTGTYGIIECGNVRGDYGYGFRLYIANGHPGVQLDDGAGNTSTVASTKSISTIANTPFDIMFTWDGTTNANAIIISVNGVAFDTLTAPTANPSRDWTNVNSLITGSIASVADQDMDLNELIVWDSVQSAIYSPRTGFWPVPTFDATQNVDPGIGNVVQNINYEIAGLPLVGTFQIAPPTAKFAGRVSQSNNLSGRVSDQLIKAVKLGARVSQSNNFGARVGVK